MSYGKSLIVSKHLKGNAYFTFVLLFGSHIYTPNVYARPEPIVTGTLNKLIGNEKVRGLKVTENPSTIWILQNTRLLSFDLDSGKKRFYSFPESKDIQFERMYRQKQILLFPTDRFLIWFNTNLKQFRKIFVSDTDQGKSLGIQKVGKSIHWVRTSGTFTINFFQNRLKKRLDFNLSNHIRPNHNFILYPSGYIFVKNRKNVFKKRLAQKTPQFIHKTSHPIKQLSYFEDSILIQTELEVVQLTPEGRVLKKIPSRQKIRSSKWEQNQHSYLLEDGTIEVIHIASRERQSMNKIFPEAKRGDWDINVKTAIYRLNNKVFGVRF